jgi:hypothetical protein
MRRTQEDSRYDRVSVASMTARFSRRSLLVIRFDDVDCARLVAANAIQFGLPACSPTRCRDRAYGETGYEPKDMTVIAGIDTNHHPSAATSLRYVTAKALNSKANDAVTQMTQDSRRILRGAVSKRAAWEIAQTFVAAEASQPGCPLCPLMRRRDSRRDHIARFEGLHRDCRHRRKTTHH